MSSATPRLSLRLVDAQTKAELGSCKMKDGGECWIGEADRAFEVHVGVTNAPATWLMHCSIDGVWLPYGIAGCGPTHCSFGHWISTDGKEKRALVFSSSKLVKREENGMGTNSSAASLISSFGSISAHLHPTLCRPIPREADGTSEPPSEAKEEEILRPLSSEQLQTRDGVKFFQQPGLCATLGAGRTTTESFYSVRLPEGAVLPSVCASTARYDLADHLILRGALTESHPLWSKYAPRQEGEADGEEPSEPSPRRMRLLKALLPPGYSLTPSVPREPPAGPPPSDEVTVDEEEDADVRSQQQPGLRRSKRRRRD